MNLKKSLFGLAMAAVLPWSIGCKNGLWGGEPEKLLPQSQLGVSDVAVPSGFELNEPESEDKSSGSWRYIRHVYYGKSDPQLVRAFYREEMGHTKWRLLEDEMRQGQYALSFENDLESCEVTVSRVKKQWSCAKTKLQIEVSPRKRDKVLNPVQRKK